MTMALDTDAIDPSWRVLRNQLGQAVWLDKLECLVCGHRQIGRLVHVATGRCVRCYRVAYGTEAKR